MAPGAGTAAGVFSLEDYEDDEYDFDQDDDGNHRDSGAPPAGPGANGYVYMGIDGHNEDGDVQMDTDSEKS